MTRWPLALKYTLLDCWLLEVANLWGGAIGTGLSTMGVAEAESVGESIVVEGIVVKGGGETGGDRKMGDPKWECMGGGEAMWLGVVVPEPKKMSEQGVLPRLEDTEVMENELEAGLYTMASRPWGCTEVEGVAGTVLAFRLEGTWNLSELAFLVGSPWVAAVDIFRRRSELRRIPKRNKVASSSAVTSAFCGSVGAGGGLSLGKSSLETPLDGL